MNAIISQKSVADQYISGKPNVSNFRACNHPFKNITPSDIVNLVNDELSRLNASHNLGAAMFSSLNLA